MVDRLVALWVAIGALFLVGCCLAGHYHHTHVIGPLLFICFGLCMFGTMIIVMFFGDDDTDVDPTGCMTGSWEDEGGL